jgi:putative Holliday junction resolvase
VDDKSNAEGGHERIVALDMGTVRIGVAASDPLGLFAQGVAVLDAAGDWMADLSKIARERNAKKILIGMPLRTDGTDGPEVTKMRRTAEKISECFPDFEILTWDERFTTAIANQTLLEADVSRAGRRAQVDKIAATVLLQSYLDAGRGTPCGAAEMAQPTQNGSPNRRRRGKRRR